MTEKKTDQLRGIATLFDKDQLKTSFSNYLYLIGGLELLILAFTFVGSVGLAKTPFPWKQYFFAAFAIPVVITFLLGIIIIAFNYFYFGERHSQMAQSAEQNEHPNSKTYRFKTIPLFYQLRRTPLMVTLFILIAGAILAYKMDDIMVVVINTSEQLLKYLFIGLGGILLLVTLFGIVWLTINYKLRKKHMEYNNQFKHEAMKQMGVILMDDQTAINQDSSLIMAPKQENEGDSKEKKNSLIILPPAK